MAVFREAYQFFEQQEGISYLCDKNFCELPYLYQIFQHLQSQQGVLFEQYKFFITNHLTPLPKTGASTVVIYISNEDHRVPPFIEDVKMVFTPYPPLENPPAHLKSIPLGYNGDIPERPMFPMNDRPVDIFFSGRKLNHRQPMIEGWEKVQQSLKLKDNTLRFKLTEKFRTGLPPDEYARLMQQSKIALAPHGNYSPITYRHFEAARQGTPVISDPLPDLWFLKSFPVVEIEDWRELPTVLSDLLSSPGQLQSLHEQMKHYYRNHCRAEVVAQYIAKEIGG